MVTFQLVNCMVFLFHSTSLVQNFVAQSLVKKLLKQHFKFPKLCRTFNKFSSRYSHLLRKYKDFLIYDLNILLSDGDGGGRPASALKKHPWHFNLQNRAR